MMLFHGSRRRSGGTPSEHRRRERTLARAGFVEPLERRTLLSGSFTPTATLAAPNVSLWGPTHTFTVTYLSNKRIRTSQLDNNDLTITGPKGYSRNARLVGYVDNVKQVIARYKVSTPNSVWNSTDNGAYTVTMNSRQVSDGGNTYVAQGVIGSFNAALPAYPSDAGNRSTGSLGAVDATVFRGRTGGGDDADFIQAAIDSLPRANGVADGTGQIGGTVWIPAGTYTLSKPLRISSGVVLRGEGSSTILNNVSTDRSSAAIQLVSYFSHGFVMQTGVEDMVINTTSAKAIAATQTQGDIIGITLSNLTLSSGGAAVDLRLSDVYQANIQNVTVKDPGSTALWMTVARGNSAINRIENFVVTGHARAGFVAERGMMVLAGNTVVDGLAIADLGAQVTPVSLMSGGITFTRLHLLSLASSLPNGTLMSFDQTQAEIDALADINGSRRLALTNARVRINTLSVGQGHSLAQALTTDAASHLTVARLRGNGGIGALSVTLATVRQYLPWVQLSIPAVDVSSRLPGPVSTAVVDATDYGAIPNDNVDDTIPIQMAIDSLPRGNGLPNTSSKQVGGLVVLPAGVYQTNASIKIPSGVWLQGQGAGSLIMSKAPSGSTAIELVAGAAAGYNVGAGVTDLTIRTLNNVAGIRANPGLTNGLFDVRLSNLEISAGGVGIDLHNVKAFHSILSALVLRDCGSAALWIGDDAGYSSDNRVTSLQLIGANRSDYIAQRAEVIISGQSVIDSVWLQTTGPRILPMLVSGSSSIRGLWAEYDGSLLADNVMLSFENCYRLDIDRLIFIGQQNRVRFRNSTGVGIRLLDSTSTMDTLSSMLDLDSTSRINIETASTFFDSGMLDDPRVTIGGNYNRNSASYVDSSIVLNGTNNNLAESVDAWSVTWGDQNGTVVGQSGYNTTDQTFFVNISSNPNHRFVNVFIDLNVTPQLEGKRAIAFLRSDGPAGVVMFTTNWAQQIPTRAVNSLTAALMPTTLRRGDKLIVQLPGVASGSFAFKLVGVTPID